MVKIVCDICKQKCRGDVLRVSDKYFHKNCFKCNKCGRSLERGGFFTKNDAYYCPEDYNRHFAVRCHLCRDQIDGEVVSALGFSFHRPCFHCRDCDLAFSPGDRVTLWADNFYCKLCLTRHQPPPVSAPAGLSRLPPHSSSTFSSSEDTSGAVDVGHRTTPLSEIDAGDRSRRSGASRDGQSSPKVRPRIQRPQSSTPALTSARDSGIGTDGGSTTDAGYMSAESAIEKRKPVPIHYEETAPVSPSYSASSVEENVNPKIRMNMRSKPPDFGRMLHQSYLSLSQRRSQSTRDEYKRSPVPFSSVPPKSQFFHRPATDHFSYRNTPKLPFIKKGTSLPSNTYKKITGQSHPKSRDLAHHLTNGNTPRDHVDSTPTANGSVPLNKEEVIRLAGYPGAHLRDSNKSPAIDRYDWPAPAATAIILAEKMRERRHRQQLLSQVSGDVSATSDDDVLSDHPSSAKDQVDSDRPTLSFLSNGSNSGMARAILLEQRRSIRKPSPLLDPISSSRVPSASSEPPNKTRYNTHSFVSPSRDTLRDAHKQHSIGYSLDYVSLGNRASTMPSSQSYNSSRADSGGGGGFNCSYPAPRPGYTQGILTHSKTESLHSYGMNPPDWDLNGRHPGDMNVSGYSGYTSVVSISVDGDRTTATSCTDGPSTSHHPHPPDASRHPIEGSLFDHRGLRRSLPPIGGMSRARGTRYCSGTMRGDSVDVLGTMSEDDRVYPAGLLYCSTASAAYRRREKIAPPVIPYEQLKVTNERLSKGLDRSKLEIYLSDSEFRQVFQMPRDAFYRLPEWKRNDVKRRELLF